MLESGCDGVAATGQNLIDNAGGGVVAGGGCRRRHGSRRWWFGHEISASFTTWPCRTVIENGAPVGM
jgi:hypothetical protein